MIEDRVAVVMVNYRTPDLVIDCLESLLEERRKLPFTISVVDGGSGDGSAERLQEAFAEERFAGWTTLLPLELNGGFGWANNQAILRLLQQEEPPSFIHLLNPDTIVEAGAIRHLIKTMKEHPQCGAAGSQLIDRNGSPAGSAFRFPTPAREFVRGSHTAALGRLLGIEPVLVPPGKRGEVDLVTGASVMLRADALRQAGLFDTGFFLYFEEIELMHRLRRAGWTVRHVPESRVHHIGGASTGVNGHDPEQVRRRPAYWYQSRRRYFALTGGRRTALLSGMAWLAGDLVWHLRRAVSRPSAKMPVPQEREDLRAHGLATRPADLAPHACAWNSPPGSPPAWLNER